MAETKTGKFGHWYPRANHEMPGTRPTRFQQLFGDHRNQKVIWDISQISNRKHWRSTGRTESQPPSVLQLQLKERGFLRR